MRRWNGWGEEGVEAPLPDRARDLLGAARRARHAADGRSPRGRRGRASRRRVSADAAAGRRCPRPRPATPAGRACPDWVALRSGRLDAVPDAVARPTTAEEVRARPALAAERRRPGHPVRRRDERRRRRDGPPGRRPARHRRPRPGLAGLRSSTRSAASRRSAPGRPARRIEAALEPVGRTLGHYPQSFERSTVGGWVVTRSAGQESSRRRAHRGAVRRRPPRGPARAAGPADPSRPRPPGRTSASSSWAPRDGSASSPTSRSGPSRVPQATRVNAFVMRDWDAALTLARTLAQRRLPLSMVRVATPLETATTFALVGDGRSQSMLRRYLGWRGLGADRERCLVLVGLTGRPRSSTRRPARSAKAVRELRGIGHARASGGLATGRLQGAEPARHAVGGGLRRGHARDGDRLDRAAGARRRRSGARCVTASRPTTSGSTRSATCRTSTRAARACTRRTCSGSPRTRTRRWTAGAGSRRAASEVIVGHGGTISHQHGVGSDHAPYLAAEKGPLGMAALDAVVRTFDPDGLMAPGRPARGRGAVTVERSADQVIAVDVGTQSVRALVFDAGRHARRDGQGPDRAVRLAPAGLGGAGSRAVLAIGRARPAGRSSRIPAVRASMPSPG